LAFSRDGAGAAVIAEQVGLLAIDKFIGAHARHGRAGFADALPEAVDAAGGLVVPVTAVAKRLRASFAASTAFPEG
jgi:hypothetical protein